MSVLTSALISPWERGASDQVDARVRCAQCYLPVRGAALSLPIDGVAQSLCCYGCYLVLRITHERGAGGQAQSLLLRLGVALFFSMNAMMFSLPTYFPYVYGSEEDGAGFLLLLRVASLLLTLPVLALLGLPVLWQALRDAAQLVVSTDALIALGTLAAFGVSVANTINGAPHVYFDTIAMLLIFVALGRYLEAQGKADTADLMRRLRDSQPNGARVERGGSIVEVAIEQLQLGDVVCLRPGDVCPVDGEIVYGQAYFDQATLTGESRPQRKTQGAEVMAGTANLDGHVRVRAIRLGSGSTLGHLRQLVEDTLAGRSRLQRIADRLATTFMPIVLSLAGATFTYWWLHAGLDQAVLSALSVLVVACPCAFGIATPTALWIGIGEAARRGALLKSPDVLEALARVRMLWFDKTGTLTSGCMTFERLRRGPAPLFAEEDLLAIARGLEAGVPHPIASALAGGAITAVDDLRYHAGLGIEGRVGSQRWLLGSPAFFAQQGAHIDSWIGAALDDASDASAVHVLLGVANAGTVAVHALLSFEDPLRDSARRAVARVQSLNVRVGVLTGGTPPRGVAAFPAAQCHAGLLPADKVAWIARSHGDGLVAMVGDGLNDAPALAAADIGIALGSKRELICEAASVTILSDDLDLVPWLIQWSRRVRRTILQNLAWALGYNGVAMLAAMTGWLNPVIAALAMIGSSVVIIANARRLRFAP